MINKFLSQYRYLKVKQNVIDNIIQFSIFIICILSLSMFIEQIFFLSKINRYKIFLTTISSILIFISYLLIKITLNLKVINQNLSNQGLAKEIGYKIPKLSDKIINILQLSGASYKNKTKKELAKIAIETNQKEINEINLKKIIPGISYIKKISSILIIAIFICLMMFLEGFSNTLDRIYNYNKEYSPPVPFRIIENNQHHNPIFEGNNKIIIFSAIGEDLPGQLILYSEQNNTIDSVIIDNKNNKFEYTFKNMRDDTKYWASHKNKKIVSAWNLIESEPNYIKVIKRPILTNINFELKYPDYIKKSNEKFESNTIQFSVLKNSYADCEVKANQRLDLAYLIINNQDTLILNQKNETWEGGFKIEEDLDIEVIGIVNFKGEGISNETPPIYKIKSEIDTPPDIIVINPEDNTFEMNSNNKIPLYFQLDDNFKLLKSWVEFSIIKPSYIKNDSAIYNSLVNTYDNDIQFIKEDYIFDTNPLNLFPGDQIKFRIAAQDNNPNPGISKSSFYYAIIPSFDDIIESMIKSEEEIQDLSNDALNQVSELEKNLEDMKLDMLKSTGVNWEHQKKGKESIERMEKLFDEIEKMQNVLDKLEEEADKGNLIDQDLVQKFDDFQELLNSIMTPELLEALQKMQEAMESMDLDKMLQATENFEYNLQQFEQQLDRFIEMFELALAEQKLNELVANLKSLVENQENIKNELENNTPSNQLTDDQERQIKDFEKLQKIIKEASKSLEKFSKNTAEALNELLNSKLNKNTQKSLNESQKKLSEQNKTADQSVSKSSENLISMLETAKDIKDSFQDESIQKMSQEFYSAIRNILTLSNAQEDLYQNFIGIRTSNPQLKPLTAKQFNINKQFSNFIHQLFELSTKTFHISPNINQKIGFCKKSIDNSIINLEQRKVKTSINEQKKIIGSMNEIALMLINSMNEMKTTGSAAGLESYLEQLQQIGEGQSQINMGTMKLGQMGMMSQQEMMKRLQGQQQALKEQLEQLIEDMPGDQGQGGLSKATEDMEEVIKNFKDNRINNETKDKQQKILSRLLDSQKSLKEKDFSDKRKGRMASNIDYDGPLDLPENLGEKDLLFINAMEKALEQDYSKEYEEIFKIYFKELHKESDE